MKYYFVSYYWENGKDKMFSNFVTDKHPFEWQNEKDNNHSNDINKIISFQEITEKEYNLFLI